MASSTSPVLDPVSSPLPARVSSPASTPWWSQLTRHAALLFATVSTVTVASLLLAFSLLGHFQANAMKDYWYDKVEVSMFLCSSVPSPSCPVPVSQQQLDELAAVLAADVRVAEVFYESSEEAFARFSQMYADSGLLESVTAAALPSSFRVKLVDPDLSAPVVAEYQGRAGVDQVADQRSALEGFFSLLSTLQSGALLLAATIAVTAMVLVATTVKLALSSRRKEVAIRRLVGASSWQVNRMFLGQTLLCSLLAVAVSVSLVAAFKAWVVDGRLALQFPFTAFVTWGDVAVAAAAVSVFALGLPLAVAWWTLARWSARNP